MIVDRVIGRFLRDETGAVTIDWVALSSGILLLGVMVVYSIFNGGVASLTGSVSATLAGTLSVEETDPSDVDDGAGGTGDPIRTGNAAERACIRTGKHTVCMGPN